MPGGFPVDGVLAVQAVRMAALAVLAGMVVYTDIRYRIVRNLHVVIAMGFGLVTGVAQRLTDGSWQTCDNSITGAATGLCAGVFLYWLGGIGAGDAKWLAGVGALSGPLFLVHVAVGASVAGFVLAAAHLLRHGGWREAARGLLTSNRTDRRVEIENPASTRTIPFGAAISLGVWWALYALGGV